MLIARIAALLGLLLGLQDVSSHADGRRRFGEPRTTPLGALLETRRSTRELAARPLTETELGHLLWAGQGVVDGHRTVPSAGALYPVTLRVADRSGVWRYVPEDHALVHEQPIDIREELAIAAHRQRHVRLAPVVVVLSADVKITAAKYGPRAERFVALEAGHAAQNILLQATELGLGAVPVGAFSDDAVRSVVGLAPDITPLYLIAIGAMP